MIRAALTALAVLVSMVGAPLAVTGFWAERALDQTDAFQQRMELAWRDEAVRAELTEQVRAEATSAIQQRFGVSGPGQNWLADLTARLVADQVPAVLQSERFAQGWGRFHRQLHSDLAAFARGRPTGSTTVEGSVVTVDITPLVTQLDLPEGIRITQQLDTGSNVEAQLRALGTVLRIRWQALAALVTALALALLAGRRRALGSALLAGAAGCLATAGWILLAPGVRPSPLGDAVRGALLAGWSTWLLVAGAALAAAGAVLLALRRPARESPEA